MLTGACFLLYTGHLGAQLFIRRVPVFTILQVIVIPTPPTSDIVLHTSYIRHHTSDIIPPISDFTSLFTNLLSLLTNIYFIKIWQLKFRIS